MTEEQFHSDLAWAVIAIAIAVFALLLLITAPYGRHARKGWGPTMPTRLAWVVMESPAAIGFLMVYLWGAQRLSLVPLMLIGMWQLHYVNRTFIYPFRIRSDGKRTAIVVVVMGAAFNLINAYLNARQLSHFGDYPNDWLLQPQFLAGVALFFVGRHINMRADRHLIALREQGEGYQIPRGWLFRYISCPNYFGEIVQWLGYALASYSLAGLSFAAFTLANLAPRAIAHHRWYQQHFEDYPKARRAWLPLLW